MSEKHPHKSKKALTSVLLAVVVSAGGYYVYDQGFIPGIGGHGHKSAELLKLKIEAMEGRNIDSQVYGMITDSSIISRLPESQQDSLRKNLKAIIDHDIDIIFSYTEIETKADGSSEAVEITSPKLSVVSTSEKGKSYDMDLVMPTLTIKQKGNDASDFILIPEGDVDLLADLMKTGKKSKTFSLKYSKASAELKFENGYTSTQNFSAEGVKLVEGRGGTTLVAIGSINSETEQKHDGNKVMMSTKAAYSKIEPGDMIKLFVGNIPPADVKLDYNYEGNEPQKGIADKNLAGDLDINELSVKFGDAGFESNADIEFKKENNALLPYGDVDVKFINYPKVLGLLAKYYPIKPDEMKSVSNFLMETGADEGNDASFEINFNGTQKPSINGKSQDEFEAVLQKYFPSETEVKQPEPIKEVPKVEKKKL